MEDPIQTSDSDLDVEVEASAGKALGAVFFICASALMIMAVIKVGLIWFT